MNIYILYMTLWRKITIKPLRKGYNSIMLIQWEWYSLLPFSISKTAVSKHDNFIYLLSTIDGEFIEQMFHASCLKRGLLRLPNGKSVKNINDHKLEMILLRNDINPQPATDVTDSSQTSVKSALHHHVNEFIPICQKMGHTISLVSISFNFPEHYFWQRNDLLHFYHAHHSVITSTDALKDTIFSPDEPLQGSCNSFTVSRCQIKFGNLQIFCFYWVVGNHPMSSWRWPYHKYIGIED